MTRTSHGHHIPGTTDLDEQFDAATARCGGIGLCSRCSKDASRIPSNAGIPEAKITIFIEISDRIKRIEIPHARYLNIENKYIGPDSFGLDFSLKCEPQYDIDRNNYMTEEIRSVEDSWLKPPESTGH